MGFLNILFVALQVICCLALIGLVMSQATKSEGLQGTIGGKTESAFQGKPGLDDKIADYTKWAAILFIVSSAILAFVKFG